mmetsp:Transcript_16882/g.16958  ORF Transcript_16882/g.16958 Transcript_16882/m.16958 type:complete len:547 (-) Transcript_16882:108-1748(-)
MRFLLCLLFSLPKNSIFSNSIWRVGSDMNICGDVRGPYFDILATNGHTESCFQDRPMSFESCRLLLRDTDQCTALTYESGLCSLHNRSHERFTLSHQLTKSVVYFQLNVHTDSCLEGIANVHSAVDRFQQCLLSNTTRKTASPTGHLPLLAIVMSVTSSWASSHRTGLHATTSNFRCYAAAHNYTFILNELPPMPSSVFFSQRHVTVLEQYLPYYQHVLHVDADSLVLNLSRSLDSFLSAPQDVQLHLHENGEVTASIYLIRNTVYSRCFMRLWAQWAPPHTPVQHTRHSLITYNTLNYDNGDLVSALLELIDPHRARHCSRTMIASNGSTNPYLDSVVRCFRSLSPGLSDTLRRVAPQIRIYLPREGFWRTHARRGRFGRWWDELYGSCYPSSDVIGHGWKAMARSFWSVNQVKTAVEQTDNIDSSLCNITEIHSGRGGNPRCMWLSRQQELRVVNHFCAWKSPACTGLSFGAAGSGGAEFEAGILEDNLCLGHLSERSRKKRDSGSCARTHALEIREVSEELFNISSESWVRQQICFTCPFSRI